MNRLGNLSRWEVREKNPLPVAGLLIILPCTGWPHREEFEVHGNGAEVESLP